MSQNENEFRTLLELLSRARLTVQSIFYGSNQNLQFSLEYYDDEMYFGFKWQLKVMAITYGKVVKTTTYTGYSQIVNILTGLANNGLVTITVPLDWCARRATKPDGKVLSPAAEHIHQQCAAAMENMKASYEDWFNPRS